MPPRKSAISGSSGLSLMASSPCSMASRACPANARPRLRWECAAAELGLSLTAWRKAAINSRFPFQHRRIAERNVSPGIAIIERDGSDRVRATGTQALLAIDPAHVCGKYQAKSQQSSRRCVVRVRLDRPFEDADRRLEIRPRHPPDIRPARATSSQAPRSSAERESARIPSAANRWGSMAAATLRVISSCTLKMSPSSRS